MTTIEWTRRPGTKGETWNPVAGCSILSPGCTHCYAMRGAQRIQLMSGDRPTHYAGTTKQVKGKPVWTGVVNPAPNATFLKPLRWKSPRTVFVNSMSDLFHEAVPDEVIDRVFAIMALTPQHTYQVLTKRSARMRAYMTSHAKHGDFQPMLRIIEAARKVRPDNLFNMTDWPLPNVWLGVSAERQKEADERVPDLLATPAAIRFVSAEPLLGPIDFEKLRQYNPHGKPWINSLTGVVTHGGYLARSPSECSLNTRTQIVPPELPPIDQIIVGGESGPDARPMHPAWARQIRDQCAAAGTAFFFKQWGAWAPLEHSEAADEAGWQGRGEWMILDRNGRLDIPDHRWPDEEEGEIAVIRLGKKRSGRILDGREHTEWPAVRA